MNFAQQGRDYVRVHIEAQRKVYADQAERIRSTRGSKHWQMDNDALEFSDAFVAEADRVLKLMEEN